LKLVRDPEDERQLWTNNRKDDREVLGEIGELHYVGGVDIDAIREILDARVPRSAKKLGHFGTLFELPGEGMFPPATSNDEHSHLMSAKRINTNSLHGSLFRHDYPMQLLEVSTIWATQRRSL
jgi:hypothetical protein